MPDFLMPSLGADMDSGVLLEWRVKPGDRVKRGDIVAVVDTQKAEIEIEVFDDGVVAELLVPEGERVPVGTPIARIGAGETAAVVPAPPAAPAGNGRAAVPAGGVAATRRRVSPVARRTAAALGVDLGAVPGTGPRGAVTKADVERAAARSTVATAEPVAPAAEPVAPAARPSAPPTADRNAAMRSAIAQLMARSKREVPHYYLAEDVDLAAALAFLERRNLELPVAERLLPAALLAKATALAVREVPELNGFWTDGAFQPGSGVHLGFAVSLRGGGLIAPAIHDADERSLTDLMGAIRDLVRRARAGTLRASEMSDPTLTLTNVGERGARAVFGVIYPPQVALVGFGRIAERPWAEGGMLAARPVTTATLAADHRQSDGATGGRLLSAIARNLQRPEEL
ncbi:MAG TPA: dihydrolipoamide acetyltransferase family protein [Thermoleophilaceae bacterium]|nr:dihydrolipoamide acetyltransferase family protein [Thermoleophilaceae bacterium]